MSLVIELELKPGALAGKESFVDRQFLIDVSPDRADMLEKMDIEELREELKINSDVLQDADHWLNRRLEQNHVPVRPVARPLMYGPWMRDKVLTGDIEVSTTSSSDSSIISDSGTWVSYDSGDLRLSSDVVSVCPRPLDEPTHSLVTYSEKATAAGKYPTVVEMPISDLNFAMHAPNLRLSERSAQQHECLGGMGDNVKMPFRMQNQLPKVLLRVRDLESFSELVVYMHVRDRNVLLKSLLPGWFLEALYTLPNRSVDSVVALDEALEKAAWDISKERTYEEIAAAGKVVNGLRANLEDLGLKEESLDYEVDLSYRLSIKAINFSARA